MASEQWTLDGFAFDDPTAGLKIRAMERSIARRRASWLENPDADGAVLGQVPRAGLQTLTFRLQYRNQADMDTALESVASLADKVEACKLDPEGLPLVWTPHQSTKTGTTRALLGEIVEMPVELGGDGYGWFLGEPVFVVSLTCLPFFEGTALENIADAFASNTIANYTFDAGAAGNVSITGGVLDAAANLTTENRAYHSASPYDLYDAQVSVKGTPGSTITSFKAGVVPKRVAATSFVEVYVDDNGTNSRLRIDKVVSGSRTNLASSNLGARVSNGTAFWLKGRIEGDVLTAEYYTSLPSVTSTPATTNTYTLTTGAEQSTFGRGVAGRAGWSFLPQQTAANLDDFLIEPNLYRSSKPIVTGEIFGVPGDASATSRLVITDGEGQHRRFVQWGSGKGGSWAHILDSDDLVTSGFSGTGDTATGAYDGTAGGNSTISTTLIDSPTAVCGTGELAHEGTFQVFTRVLVTETDCHLRFSWQDKDGPRTANTWAQPAVADEWADVPLGLVTIVESGFGDQVWSGQLEAYSDTSASLDVDFIGLIPVDDGHGIARAVAGTATGTLVGYDQFTGTTTGNALGTRSAPLGGSWATSGDATDFAFSDDFSKETLKRSVDPSTNGRFAILGSTNYTGCIVEAMMLHDSIGDEPPNAVTSGVIARWTDSSNYLRAVFYRDSTPGPAQTILEILEVVGGVTTSIATASTTTITGGKFAENWFKMRLTVTVGGVATAELIATGLTDGTPAGTYGGPAGSVIVSAQASRTSLATGGTLATGKPGLFDIYLGSTGTINRYYDNFTISTLPAEPIVIYSGQNMRVLHDQALRADSDSGRYGALPYYQPAGHFYIQPAGDEGRSTHVAVRAHRNDLRSLSYETIDDILQFQVLWTPRSNVVPQ